MLYVHISSGNTISGQSIGGNSTYWLHIKSILESNHAPDIKEGMLADAIHRQNVDTVPSTPASMSDHLASETMALYNDGLLNDLDVPLTYGK